MAMNNFGLNNAPQQQPVLVPDYNNLSLLCQQLMTVLNQKEIELKSSQQQLALANIELKSLQKKLQEQQVQANRDSSDLAFQVQQLLQSNTQLGNQLPQLVQTNVQLETQLNICANIIDTQRAAISEKDEKIHQQELEITKLKNVLNSLAFSLVTSKNENAQLRKTLANGSSRNFQEPVRNYNPSFNYSQSVPVLYSANSSTANTAVVQHPLQPNQLNISTTNA